LWPSPLGKLSEHIGELSGASGGGGSDHVSKMFPQWFSGLAPNPFGVEEQ
jgi:hypothetical protein